MAATAPRGFWGVESGWWALCIGGRAFGGGGLQILWCLAPQVNRLGNHQASRTGNCFVALLVGPDVQISDFFSGCAHNMSSYSKYLPPSGRGEEGRRPMSAVSSDQGAIGRYGVVVCPVCHVCPAVCSNRALARDMGCFLLNTITPDTVCTR